MIEPLAALLLVCQAKSPPSFESHAQTLSADEKFFAYSVDDGTLHIVSLPEGKPVLVVSGFARRLGGLAFSPDGKELASVALDGLIRIVASEDGKVIAEYKGPPSVFACWGSSRAISYMDGGMKLLVGGWSAEAGLLRRSNGEWLKHIQLGAGRVTAMAVSADGAHFTVGDEMGSSAVYSAKSGELEFGPIKAKGHVNALALDAQGQRLAVGSSDDQARLYTLAKGATPILLSHGSENLTGELEIGYVAFSLDGKQVLSTSLLGWDMRVWDAGTGAMQWTTTRGFEGAEYPVIAHFVALPEPGVITCNGFLFDAGSGRALPSIGTDSEWAHLMLAGSYAWRMGPFSIKLIDVHTLKFVCELPLGATGTAR